MTVEDRQMDLIDEELKRLAFNLNVDFVEVEGWHLIHLLKECNKAIESRISEDEAFARIFRKRQMELKGR